MSDDSQHKLQRIRTFSDDVARVRDDQNLPPLEATDAPEATEVMTPPAAPAPQPKPETPPIATHTIPTAPRPPHIPAAPTPKAAVVPRTQTEPNVVVPTHTPPPLAAHHAAPVSKAPAPNVTPTVPYKTSHLVDTNEFGAESEGTIIKDTKHGRFRLLPAIFASVQKNRARSTARAQRQERQERILNKAETRAATIATAAQGSHIVAPNDYVAVAKRIAAAPHAAPTPTVTIKQKADLPEPSWTHHVDEPDAAPKPAPAPLREPVPQQTPAKPIPVTESVPPVPIVETQPAVKTVAPKPPLQAPAPAAPNVAPEQKATTKTTTPAAVPQQPATPKQRPTPNYARRRRILTYVAVSTAAVFLGTLTAVMWFRGFASVRPTAATVTPPPVLISATPTAIPLGPNRADTLQAILTAASHGSSTAELYLASTTARTAATPASPTTILGTLGFNAPGAFIRSITGIVFGRTLDAKPFIVMQVSDFNTAFAGMLGWEPNMSTDLSPLFGQPVTQSFDPLANSSSTVRTAFFRDTVVNNQSARLLVDANNTDHIIYSFPNPHLLIIAPDQVTLTEAMTLVAKQQ